MYVCQGYEKQKILREVILVDQAHQEESGGFGGSPVQ